MKRKDVRHAAAALGRLGGLKRAKTLSKKKITDIAKKAAAARNVKVSDERKSQIGRKGAKARWGARKGGKQ
jgi:hypothetical protein